jgi:hypothetical protein
MDSDPVTTTERSAEGKFRKGKSGNPQGRPVGSRNKSSFFLEALIEGEGEKLTRKVIDMALEGNLVALRLCIERLLPPRRDRSISVSLPEIKDATSARAAAASVLAAVGDGQISPAEGETLTEMIEAQSRIIVAADFERRIAELEDIVNCAKAEAEEENPHSPP